MGVDEFVRRSKERFGDKFDYSKVVYKNDSTNVELVCPIHGTFSIAPYSHLRSKTGCRECGIDITRSKLAKDKEYFVQRAREVHGERFLYDNFEYINWHTPSYVSCPIHGDFPVTPNNHIDNGSGCPKCSSPTSKWENEVFEFVKSLGLKCNQSNREFLGRQEIDVYIPILKLGIECNGLLWHNEIHKSEDFHLSKSNACAEQGINLVHIFEDEWLYKNEIVKGILKTLVNSNGKKVRAINCIVKNVEASNAKTFLEENHIDGSIESDINIGLYHGNELVSIMSFNKIEDGKHNITRACNLLDVTVIGGYKKLFEYFINTFKPSEITAFANIRWPNEKIYESLGFKHVEDTAPDYFYVIGSHRKDKSSYTKDILTNEGYDSSKTEHEIMLERGIYRIYDCGKRSYQWSIN